MIDAGFTVAAPRLTVGTGPLAGPGVVGQSLGNVAATEVAVARDTFCTCRAARQLGYGVGWPGTVGVPALVAFERPVPGRTIALFAGNSLGTATTGLLLLGRQPADVTTPFGGTLLVRIDVGLGVAVGVAGVQVSVAIPDDAALCGQSMFVQMLELDAGASRGLSFTPGLELQFGM